MATTQKGLVARAAASAGAIALAAMIALGGALPAAAAPNINMDADASITIHKHAQPAGELPIGTGDPLDPAPGDPIKDVTFHILPVGGLPLNTNEAWATLSAPNALTAADVLAAPSTYPLGTAIPAITGTDGSITTNVDVGVYLVREISAPASAGVAIQSQPFLVVVPQPRVVTNATDWNYNVHVYPKNTVVNVVKSEPTATQQGLGSTVPWTITTNAPIASQGKAVTFYAIQDELDARLQYVADSAVVTVGGTPLVTPRDYSVSSPATPGGTVRVDFTSPDGLTALKNANGGPVVLTFNTVVVALTAPGETPGVITNVGSVFVNDSRIDSNEVRDYWGGVELKKVDDDATNPEALAGAKFRVYHPTDLAFATPIVINGVSEWTSDANGIVTIHGLRTNAGGTLPYVIREVAAPAGHTIGSTSSWTIPVPVGTTTAIELQVVNPQVPPYELPVTGGSGETAFLIGGFGLLIVAIGAALIRRRKVQADA